MDRRIPATDAERVPLSERLIAKGERIGIEKGIERGREEGIEMGVEKTARRMLARGMDPETVADNSGIYDADPKGSPDGTKICFVSNYDLEDAPVTRITADAGRDDRVGGFGGLDSQLSPIPFRVVVADDADLVASLHAQAL